jgi:hypothetical protein
MYLGLSINNIITIKYNWMKQLHSQPKLIIWRFEFHMLGSVETFMAKREMNC